MNNQRIIKLLFILALLSLCLSSCTRKKVRKVLIVHSYEENYAGYPQFNQLILDEFEKRNIKADIRIIYLDCELYQEKEELERINNLLNTTTAVWKPEVILVNEDQATYSLLKSKNPIVNQLPIVFGGVNYPNWKLIKQFSNVTGFHNKINFKENIKMGKKLFGLKTNFFSILDSTFIDIKIRADLQKQLKQENVDCVNDRFNYMNLSSDIKGHTMYSLISVRHANKNGGGPLIWSLSKYAREHCYLQVKRDFTTTNISNICSSPSLTAINEAFGFGEKILGGYFTPLSIQVEEEVEAATEILHGKKPSDLFIRESKKQHVIDWKVMEQLNIPVSKIPSEYTIANIPFRVKYYTLWLVIMIILGVLLVSLISWLTYLYRREYQRKKKALYALADEKETLALAIEGSNTFAWKLEENHLIFEKTFWQSLNLPSEILTIEGIIELLHPDYKELFITNWKKLATAQKEIVQVQCDFNGKGYQWWEFRYTTTCTGKCRTAGLLLNIQSFKERERELDDARKLAEKAELKESFLANISHEIRTPLNAIVGFSTMLASDEELDKEEKQDYIQTINHNNQVLLKLINDILELSRIKSGYMLLTFEWCRIDDLINNIYITHQLLMPAEIVFLKETDESVKLEINVDKGRLTQVIGNFLNNACKFTSKGYIKLGYRYISEGEEVQIFVEDTGQGIDMEEQKIIFNRFYKHNEFAQGTGLGLSICQGIIEKLNGRIELWSERGKGSRFTIILPCKVIF